MAAPAVAASVPARAGPCGAGMRPRAHACAPDRSYWVAVPDPQVAHDSEVLSVARTVRPRGRHGQDGEAASCGEHLGPCEDLNQPAPLPPIALPRMAPDTARRLRRLHDIEAAALATATVLLGRFDPRSAAAARPRVSADGTSVATAEGAHLPVPHYARALLRGWSGRDLVETDWADDVAATYLTVRLELAERRTGLQLTDPAMPPLPPVAWHSRFDPGARLLAELTGSAGYERDEDLQDAPLDWGLAR